MILIFHQNIKDVLIKQTTQEEKDIILIKNQIYLNIVIIDVKLVKEKEIQLTITV